MNHALKTFSIAGISALILLSSYTAQSAEQNSNAVAALPADAVVIVEDQEAKAFRFMIDGEEVARLDAAGLHVRESVEYGGAITDVGVASYGTDKGKEAP